jgi:hypothetical protein
MVDDDDEDMTSAASYTDRVRSGLEFETTTNSEESTLISAVSDSGDEASLFGYSNSQSPTPRESNIPVLRQLPSFGTLTSGSNNTVNTGMSSYTTTEDTTRRDCKFQQRKSLLTPGHSFKDDNNSSSVPKATTHDLDASNIQFQSRDNSFIFLKQ